MPVGATVSSSVPWLFTPSDTPYYIALNADFNGIASALSTFPPTPTRAGDILYATGTTASTWTNLAGNNSGTQFLQESSAGVPSWAAVSSSGTLVIINTYASTQTITIPATATRASIRLWGGAGGSGGITAVATSATGGSGAAGYLEKYLTGLTPGNTLAWTQGAAGAAGSNAGGNGGNGGASSLASGTQTITTLTANGSNGSTGVTVGGTTTAGTAGGTASNGDINLTGPGGTAGGVFSIGNATTFNITAVNVYSQGASGVTTASAGPVATAGNAGVAGGMIVFWFS